MSQNIRVLNQERTQIFEEISRNNARNRKLRIRLKQVETDIAQYLQSTGDVGFKYGERGAVYLDKRERHKPKPPKQKEEAMKMALRNAGIDEDSLPEVFNNLQVAMRGQAVVEDKLVYRKLPKK